MHKHLPQFYYTCVAGHAEAWCGLVEDVLDAQAVVLASGGSAQVDGDLAVDAREPGGAGARVAGGGEWAGAVEAGLGGAEVGLAAVAGVGGRACAGVGAGGGLVEA